MKGTLLICILNNCAIFYSYVIHIGSNQYFEMNSDSLVKINTEAFINTIHTETNETINKHLYLFTVYTLKGYVVNE